MAEPDRPDGLDPIEVLLIERACRRLVLDYAHHVDSGHAARVAELFTDDGTWLGADGRGMTGRGEILAAFRRREQRTTRVSRHVCTNIRIDVESAGRARGTSYLVNYRHDRTGGAAAPAPARHPKFVGEYRDRYRRERGVWLIEHREFQLDFLRTFRPSGIEPSTSATATSGSPA
jgi:uncharacterized protein (TIGR02246 family)